MSFHKVTYPPGLGGSVLLVVLMLILSACTREADTVDEEAPDPGGMTLSSPDFEDGGEIPPRFTCDGEDLSPALEWSGIPGDAVELALIVDDPDAPGGTFVHWVLLTISPQTGGLAQGQVPDGATQGRNDFGESGYRGPCPPPGPAHNYFFSLSASSAALGLDEGATAEQVREALTENEVGRVQIIGSYGR